MFHRSTPISFAASTEASPRQHGPVWALRHIGHFSPALVERYQGLAQGGTEVNVALSSTLCEPVLMVIYPYSIARSSDSTISIAKSVITPAGLAAMAAP